MTPKALLSGLIVASLAGAASPALAQWRVDPSAPLDISAPEQGEYKTATCTLDLRGGVQITQGRVRLIGQTITANQAKRGSSCGAWTRLVAERDVYYVTPDERVRADRAVYDFPNETVTFTGGVILVRGQDVATADRVVVDLRTNDFTLSGKVKSVIYPESSEP